MGQAWWTARRRVNAPALRRRARRSATDRLRQRHRALRLRPCRLRASRCRTRLSPRRWIRPLAGDSPSAALSTDTSTGMSARWTTATYQNGFQVQLPLPANWNGRYMVQGGGGTEGSVPTATGTIGGSTGIAEVSNGYAIASQDGGHENTDLAAPTCGILPPASRLQSNDNSGLRKPQRVLPRSDGQRSARPTNRSRQRRWPRSTWSTSTTARARTIHTGSAVRLADAKAMGMSQNFPSFFDGIVAGDPDLRSRSGRASAKSIGAEADAEHLPNETRIACRRSRHIAQPAPEAGCTALVSGIPV